MCSWKKGISLGSYKHHWLTTLKLKHVTVIQTVYWLDFVRVCDVSHFHHVTGLVAVELCWSQGVCAWCGGLCYIESAYIVFVLILNEVLDCLYPLRHTNVIV